MTYKCPFSGIKTNIIYNQLQIFLCRFDFLQYMVQKALHLRSLHKKLPCNSTTEIIPFFSTEVLALLCSQGCSTHENQTYPSFVTNMICSLEIHVYSAGSFPYNSISCLSSQLKNENNPLLKSYTMR